MYKKYLEPQKNYADIVIGEERYCRFCNLRSHKPNLAKEKDISPELSHLLKLNETTSKD